MIRRACSLRATGSKLVLQLRRPVSSLQHFHKQSFQLSWTRCPSLSRNFSTTTQFSKNKDEKYQSVDDLVDGKDEIRVDNEYMKSYDDEHAPKSLDDKQHLLEDGVDDNEQSITWQEKALPVVIKWGPKVLGSTLMAYVFTKTSLYITTELLNITLTDAVWFGFGSGFFTSSATALSAFVSCSLVSSLLSSFFLLGSFLELTRVLCSTRSSLQFFCCLFFSRSCGTRSTQFVLSPCIVLP